MLKTYRQKNAANCGQWWSILYGNMVSTKYFRLGVQLHSRVRAQHEALGSIPRTETEHSKNKTTIDIV